MTNRPKIGQQTSSRAHMCLHYFVKSSAANNARFELERNRNPIINACCGRQISAKIDFYTIKMDDLLFFFWRIHVRDAAGFDLIMVLICVRVVHIRTILVFK